MRRIARGIDAARPVQSTNEGDPSMSTYENLQQAANDTKRTTRNLSEQSHRVLEDVKELGHTALSSASEAAGHLRERGALALETGKEKAVAAKNQIETMVIDNPM